MKVISKERCEIDVRRPDGTTETVTAKFDRLNDVLFARMHEANREAGRGELLAYRNIEAVVEMEESDYQGRCERCGVEVDTRTAYSQQEWGRLCGSRVRVTAHYCDACCRTLAAVGQGEVTDLEHRAAERPDMTPETKED